MRQKSFFSLLFLFFIMLSEKALAHCPLCTIGAAAVAGGAMWLGVSTVVVGIFIGAFAVSTGYWVSRIIKKQYFRFQKSAIIFFSFVSTIIPMMSVIKDQFSVPVWWFGSYGTLFNRIYLLNSFFVGSLVGGGIAMLTPWLSVRITAWRKGTMMPFQGVILTLSLLVVVGVIVQLLV